MRRDLSINLPLSLHFLKQSIRANNSDIYQKLLRNYLPEDYVFDNSYIPIKNTNYSLPKEFQYFRQKLLKRLLEFEKVQSTLFFSANQRSPYYYIWTDPSVPLKYYLGNGTPVWDNKLSMWDASSEFWTHARSILNHPDPAKLFEEGTLEQDLNWR